jgi:Domain of unknown function (DUF1929)
MVLCLAAASLLVATGTLPLAAADQPPPAAAVKVCGTYTADATYPREVRMLGKAHACDHLAERRSTGSVPDHEHQSLADAVAAAVTAAVAAAAVSTDPAVSGSWSTPFSPATRTVGITSVLLHTGKVLLFGGTASAGSVNTAAYVFDPVTRTGKDVPAPAPVFCGSVTQLSDGRVLSVGGANPVPKGIKDVYLFDSVSEAWVRQPDTPLGRYYPTSTRLPDGQVLIAAGTEPDGTTKNPKVEIYTPPAAGGSVGSLAVVGPDHPTPFYPKQWVMPDGKLLQVASRLTYRFDPATRSWTTLRSKPVSNSAAGAMMVAGPPSGSNQVMVMGGLPAGSAAMATVQKYDYATNTWTRTVDMPTPRAHLNVVQVPDGKAIGVGGNSSGLSATPQYAAMSYDPAVDQWTTLASQTPRRAYHSTALLLPDGRIMSAGDDKTGGGKQLIDFYSPPYLFAGVRPTVTSSPTQVDFGSTFPIGTADAVVTRAVLMAPGATTHAVDMNARHVELAVTPTGDGTTFTATAPTASVAPPGYYMLFALTSAGVPSVARWVHVGPLA